MAVRVIYVAGVPASGKSSLLRRVREELFVGAVPFKDGKVRGIERGPLKMLGVFDGSLFEGTDRLSMTVIDDAIAYVKGLEANVGRYVVFVEGDRLFNARFITETQALPLIIDANDRVLAHRHALRGDDQTDTFLKSRRTKVENFIKRYNLPRVWNNTPQDQQRILDFIITFTDTYLNPR